MTSTAHESLPAPPARPRRGSFIGIYVVQHTVSAAAAEHIRQDQNHGRGDSKTLDSRWSSSRPDKAARHRAIYAVYGSFSRWTGHNTRVWLALAVASGKHRSAQTVPRQ